MACSVQVPFGLDNFMQEADVVDGAGAEPPQAIGTELTLSKSRLITST